MIDIYHIIIIIICIISFHVHSQPYFLIYREPNFFEISQPEKVTLNNAFLFVYTFKLYVSEPGGFLTFAMDFSTNDISINAAKIMEISQSTRSSLAFSWTYSSALFNISLLEPTEISGFDGIFGLGFPTAEIWQLFQTATMTFRTFSSGELVFGDRVMRQQNILSDTTPPSPCFSDGSLTSSGVICYTPAEFGNDTQNLRRHVVLLTPGSSLIRMSPSSFQSFFGTSEEEVDLSNLSNLPVLYISFISSEDGSRIDPYAITSNTYVVEADNGIKRLQVVGDAADGTLYLGLAASGLMLFFNGSTSTVTVVERFDVENWTALNITSVYIYMIFIIVYIWNNNLNLSGDPNYKAIIVTLVTEVVTSAFSIFFFFTNYFVSTQNIHRKVSYFKISETQHETNVVLFVNLCLHTFGGLLSLYFVFREYLGGEEQKSILSRIIRRTVFDYLIHNGIFIVFTEGPSNSFFYIIVILNGVIWIHFMMSYWVALFDLTFIQDGILNKKYKKIKRKYLSNEMAILLWIVLTVYIMYALYFDIIFMIKPGISFFFEGFVNIFGFLIFTAGSAIVLSIWVVSVHMRTYVQYLFGDDLKYIYDDYTLINEHKKK